MKTGLFGFGMVPSAARAASPVSITVKAGVTLTAVGMISINGMDFHPAGFRVEAEGKVIYIDPVAVDDPKPADVVIVTHSHPDHCSKDDVARLEKDGTVVVCPAKAAAALSANERDLRVIAPGESLVIGGVRIEATHAYNLKPVLPFLYPHPKSAKNVGYLITVAGTRIWHSGDTDSVPELDSIGSLDAALVPLGGDRLTMDAVEAAALVNRLKPAIAVPMHYPEGKGLAEKFRGLVEAGIEVVIP